MNLTHLQQLAQESNRLQAHGTTDSLAEHTEGMAFLRQAIGQGFSDVDLIQRASEIFSKAIEKSTREPEPYLGMGYIFFLFEKFSSSISCLEYVLRLQPQQLQAKNLLEKIREIAKGRIPLSQKEVEQIDREMMCQAVDNVFELVEKAIIVRSRLLMGMHLEPVPELDSESDAQCKRLYLVIDELCRKLNIYLEYLDQEVDVSNLWLHLQQFRKKLKLCEQKISLSRELRELDWVLQDHCLRASQLNEELHRGLNRSENKLAHKQFLIDFDRQLNWLIDQCDLCADQLDAHEKYGNLLKPLLVKYRKLVNLIEEIQINIEEI